MSLLYSIPLAYFWFGICVISYMHRRRRFSVIGMLRHMCLGIYSDRAVCWDAHSIKQNSVWWFLREKVGEASTYTYLCMHVDVREIYTRTFWSVHQNYYAKKIAFELRYVVYAVNIFVHMETKTNIWANKCWTIFIEFITLIAIRQRRQRIYLNKICMPEHIYAVPVLHTYIRV